MSNSYQVSNGQIVDSNGNVFIARGIDVMEGNQPSAALLQQDFPGINFVRLAIYDYASPTALASYVTDLTSHGIVVDLEDHTNSNGSNAGGSQGQIFTGQQLTNELNWYSSIASAFKNNPLVWFGTNNEPSEYDSSGNFNASALSDWQLQTYNAVRNAGNTSPILLEANGWSSNGAPVMLQGYKASDYAGMNNVVWDPHYYGWLTNYSTDQATNNNFVAQMIQQVQQITSANGKIPVIFGEYGNSTTGMTIDANGNQVIQAVLNSGAGNVAWAWGTGNPGDGLTNSDNSLSAYGKLVAAGIAAQASKNPTPTPTPTPRPTPTPTPTPTATVTPSANDTVVKTGSAAAITDAGGNKWTITSGGQVAVNGTIDATTANVTEIAYVSGEVWQENASNLWWGKTSATAAWGPAAGTATSPLPVAATPTPIQTGTITLRMSEDAYQGDAQFTVKVDGQQVGGTYTASALHSTGDDNVFLLTGNWATGSHQVAVTFINDVYGGTASTDRNLYVDSVAYKTTTQSGASASLMSNGTSTFTVGSSTSAAAAPADTLTVHLSEDAYQGNAQFTLLVDGKAITTAQDVVASHAAGAWQDLTFSGNFGTGSHTIGIRFANDAYGGTTTTDRNLYVNGIDVNGAHYGSGVNAMLSNGTTNFTVVTAH